MEEFRLGIRQPFAPALCCSSRALSSFQLQVRVRYGQLLNRLTSKSTADLRCLEAERSELGISRAIGQARRRGWRVLSRPLHESLSEQSTGRLVLHQSNQTGLLRRQRSTDIPRHVCPMRTTGRYSGAPLRFEPWSQVHRESSKALLLGSLCHPRKLAEQLRLGHFPVAEYCFR